MACSGCGGSPLNLPGDVLAMTMNRTISGPSDDIAAGLVRLEYIGGMAGNITYTGRATGIDYYAGNNSSGKYIDVDPNDAPHLVSLGVFRVVDLSHLKKAQQAEVIEQVNTAAPGTNLTAADVKQASKESQADLASNELLPLNVDIDEAANNPQVLGGKDGLPTNQPNLAANQIVTEADVAEAQATGQVLDQQATAEVLQDKALEEDGLPSPKKKTGK